MIAAANITKQPAVRLGVENLKTGGGQVATGMQSSKANVWTVFRSKLSEILRQQGTKVKFGGYKLCRCLVVFQGRRTLGALPGWRLFTTSLGRDSLDLQLRSFRKAIPSALKLNKILILALLNGFSILFFYAILLLVLVCLHSAAVVTLHKKNAKSRRFSARLL